MNWITDTTTGYDLTYTPSGHESSRSRSYFQVNYTHERAAPYLFNFTSTLFVTDFNANGTNVTCEKIESGDTTDNATTVICITGTMYVISVCLFLIKSLNVSTPSQLAMASSPTVSSVVWNSVSATVSLLPPVYGAQCVDYYVVTALSEDRNITCNSTSDGLIHDCNIPPNSNVNDYNFTVHSVTKGVDGGSITTDYCSMFVTKKCHVYNII